MDGAVRLLDLEIETLWVADGRRRLVRSRTSEVRPAPLLTVAAGAGGIVWRCSAAVGDEVEARIGHVLATERRPETPPPVGWAPAAAGVLLDVLASAHPVGPVERGPSYVATAIPPVPGAVDCWVGTDGDRARLAGRMPEDERRDLLEPWAVAVVGGRVAAVCETARSAPRSVEAGVRTYEPHRRRGFGTAASAAWMGLVADRTIFYSTSSDNLGSQGIARTLGLAPLGQWWHVVAAARTGR